ncbi:unnamed protein product [Callosobruchus maculatus]|uniref:Uncharacterized protein n=1 Tax=Callosobruchus maculatus TaxID=64391 RepID=A0A653DC44_CALMS|nr:unnamed protein product [Callosobruchus maculatus]
MTSTQLLSLKFGFYLLQPATYRATVDREVPAYFEYWQYTQMMVETLWLKKGVIPHECSYELGMKTTKHLRNKRFRLCV